jgi:hypothetical protein
MPGVRGTLLVALLALAGCPNAPFTNCDIEPDLTGHWILTVTPIADGGVPRADTIDAQLRQVRRNGVGSFVWGTLTSSDKGVFDKLEIPELMNNNGSKTGGVFGCEIKINVPVTTHVTDDDAANGPLRLSLSGNITSRGMMTGGVSTVIRVDDPAMMEDSFTWIAVQQ